MISTRHNSKIAKELLLQSYTNQLTIGNKERMIFLKNLIRGEKRKMADFTPSNQIQIEVQIQSNLEIDISCFGLDHNKNLSDDRYMIFYNQLQSPSKEIELLNHRNGVGIYQIDLSKLPSSIQYLVFTATIDGNSNMSMIHSGAIIIKANGQSLLQYSFQGSDFQNQKAVIISELYLKSVWRVSAVGQGFDGGLAALLKHFGGEVAEEQAPPKSSENPKKIQLEKKMAEKAPKILDLSKKARISLEKVGLQDHNAKVALCLDISGSMYKLYKSGKIQEFSERILALGTRFDDDGAIDIFLFGKHPYDVGELTIDNFNGFINRINKKYPLEGGTYYGKVMQTIRNHYFNSAAKRNKPFSQQIPIYVMFVTDGATFDEQITINQLIDSSYEPIFWQFMAIGKSNKDVKNRGFFQRLLETDFRFLEELDNLKGRYIDNANFFSVEDPANIPDHELYDLLMTEYPDWIKEATTKGLINKEKSRAN